MRTITLAEAPGVLAEHLDAVNAHDLDAVMATFSTDAYVNDDSREIRGTAAIREFFAQEMIGDSVTIDPVVVLEHHGQVVVRGRFEGTYDTTDLPDPLVMTLYYAVDGDQVVSLTIIFTKPSAYDALAT